MSSGLCIDPLTLASLMAEYAVAAKVFLFGSQRRRCTYTWISSYGIAYMDIVTCATVQIEMHALFRCQDLFVCSFKDIYPFSLFTNQSVEAPYILQSPKRLYLISFLSGTEDLVSYLIPDSNVGHHGLLLG